jgi:tetratricopeptide (TPR) repeat protein
LLVPRLRDRARAVRIEAARLLLSVADTLAGDDRAAFDAALIEHEAALRQDLSRPESQLNLGNLLLQRGESQAAESAFRRSLALDPRFVPAAVNLADLLRGRGDEIGAERVLRDSLRALGSVAAAAPLRESLGLALVRQGRKPEALAEFQAAVRAAPDLPRYAYLYALALDDAGRRPEAIKTLAAGAERAPDRDLLLTLAMFRSEGGDEAGARAALARWYAINPDDPALANLPR